MIAMVPCGGAVRWVAGRSISVGAWWLWILGVVCCPCVMFVLWLESVVVSEKNYQNSNNSPLHLTAPSRE